MTTRVMIIDGDATFRTLLMHHVSAHWPDADITMFDPLQNGHLPDTFLGAGNDIVLLGDVHGDRDGLDVLLQFKSRPSFPPVIYFCESGKGLRDKALARGADGALQREHFDHAALAVLLATLLRSRQRVANTSSLFVGDMRIGVNPLIRGYTLKRKLSVHEHSGVYLARHDKTGRDVVLKVLRNDPDAGDALGAFDRFLQEYELIADLDHPNIVRIHDLGVSDEHAHIAMEYLAGGDLKAKILQGVTPADAVNYVRQIASALAEIHRIGITHRDLKPGNIMLRADGSIALIDFGLAKHMRLTQEITDSGEIFGTPYYMSPEQGRGNDVDHRSDIYSLGIIFYELLTGEKPYKASNAMGIIFKHSEAPLPVLPPPVAEFQDLLNLMLAKKPINRLQHATEVEGWL